MAEEIKDELKPFICPHCKKEVDLIKTRSFGTPPLIMILVACAKCLKILGVAPGK